MIPGAQKIFASYASLSNRYTHTQELVSPAYSAVFQSNSWGSALTTSYTTISAEMDDIFEQIALELRHQYSIGYKPANFVTDGKWHKIKVKISPPRGLPRLFVRSKEGYFAVASTR